MHRIANSVLGVCLLIILATGSGAFFVVSESEQVVLTQFGEPIGNSITHAGLYFKLPFVQTANYFEKRILQWNGDPNQIPTRDKRYIWVDTTARWRIVDALKFMQSVGNEETAQARLDDIIDAAARDAISNADLIEAVRNSNRLLEKNSSGKVADDNDLQGLNDEALERVSEGREAITRDILKRASALMPSFGIELVDMRIKRISYVQDVRKKVFDRMISERKRAAEQFRSEGQGKKAEIEGQMSKELNDIQSGAYRKAQEIIGEADAKAIKIYADAYNNDPEFYSFLKTLDTYKTTIGADSTLLLTTDSDYFEYIKRIKGGVTNP